MADPPVPIPNTEVKRHSADDTASARVWENKSLPGDYLGERPAFSWAFFADGPICPAAGLKCPDSSRLQAGPLRKAEHQIHILDCGPRGTFTEIVKLNDQ